MGMIHLGDITDINGAEIPVVDVITGGSPCQDLSVAGKREGLEGERSGLFMEQVRVVKEMREHDRNNGRTGEFIRPRYMVWENVPGALSSAGKGKPKGSDFQAVLTEITKIVKTDAPDVPIPDKGWTKSGTLMGVGDDGCPFSISYRLHDAQLWGVPQRRKRLALVADFGGLSAPEILFERKGLSGHFEESEGEEQATAEGVGRSVNESSGSTIAIEGNGSRSSHHGDGYKKTDKMYSLNTVETHAVFADMYNHSVTGDIDATLNASSCNSPTHSGPTVIEDEDDID